MSESKPRRREMLEMPDAESFTPPVETVIDQILKISAELKARDPRNMVFEYSPYAPRKQVIVMNRSQFSDGRHRVISHPDHQEAIEKALATLDAESV